MTLELTDNAGMPAPAVSQLAAVRTELELQRSFRIDQIEEVEFDATEALAAGDLDQGRIRRGRRGDEPYCPAGFDGAMSRILEQKRVVMLGHCRLRLSIWVGVR